MVADSQVFNLSHEIPNLQSLTHPITEAGMQADIITRRIPVEVIYELFSFMNSGINTTTRDSTYDNIDDESDEEEYVWDDEEMNDQITLSYFIKVLIEQLIILLSLLFLFAFFYIQKNTLTGLKLCDL